MKNSMNLGLVMAMVAACGTSASGTLSPAPDAGPTAVPECEEGMYGDACNSGFHCASGEPIPGAQLCTGGRRTCSVDMRRPLCPAPTMMERGHVFVACGGPPFGSLAHLDFDTYIPGRMAITAYNRGLRVQRLPLGLRLASGNGFVAEEGGVPYFDRCRAFNGLNGDVLMGPVSLTNIARDRRYGDFIFAKGFDIPMNEIIQFHFGLTIGNAERRYGDLARSSYALRFGSGRVNRVFDEGDLVWADGAPVTADQVSYDPACFDRPGAGTMGEFRVVYRGADLVLDVDTNVRLGDQTVPNRLTAVAFRLDNHGSGGGQVVGGVLTAFARIEGDDARPIAFERLVSDCQIVGNGGAVLSQAPVAGNTITPNLLSNEATPNGAAFSSLQCGFVWPSGLAAAYIEIRIGAAPDGFISRASNVGEVSRVVGAGMLDQNRFALPPSPWVLRVRPSTP